MGDVGRYDRAFKYRIEFMGKRAADLSEILTHRIVFSHINQPSMHVMKAANLSSSDSVGIVSKHGRLVREEDKAFAFAGYRGFRVRLTFDKDRTHGRG